MLVKRDLLFLLSIMAYGRKKFEMIYTTKAIKKMLDKDKNAPLNLYCFPYCEQCLFCHCFTIILKIDLIIK